MTTDKKTYPGVILLPWITIKEPVKVGRYSLISTDELEFSSKRLESRFRAFLGRHRNRQGEPVTQAVMMAIDGNGVLDVSEDEINDATSWIPVFFVLANEAAAFRRNLAVAENFDWIFHTLAPVEKGIVLETGSVLKERGYLGPSQKVSFQIPAAANAECIVAADSLIAAALDAAIASDDSVTPNVIRRSAELLLQSFINDQRISSQTRLLLTFFALETILEADDRRAFRELIDEWCGTTGEPTQPCDVRTRRRGRDVWLKLALTEKQIWSNEFYELRNRITHEPVTDRDLEYENGQQHFWIAFDFYRVALNRRLSGHGSFVSLVDVKKNDAGEFELKRTSFRRKQDVDRGLFGRKPRQVAAEIIEDDAEASAERAIGAPAAAAGGGRSNGRPDGGMDGRKSAAPPAGGSSSDQPAVVSEPVASEAVASAAPETSVSGEPNGSDPDRPDGSGRRKRRRRRGGRGRNKGPVDEGQQREPTSREPGQRDPAPMRAEARDGSDNRGGRPPSPRPNRGERTVGADEGDQRGVDHNQRRSRWGDLFPNRPRNNYGRRR